MKKQENIIKLTDSILIIKGYFDKDDDRSFFINTYEKETE